MWTVLLLIYLAEVFGGISVASGLAVILIAVLGGISCLICVFEEMTDYWLKWAKIMLPWFVLCLVLSVFLPSKNLIYIAAGLQAGEEVAKTEIAQKAYILLDSTLDELISERLEKK